MRRQRPEQEDPASWLATFGDLATLLLTFYVLIYASCTYRPGQWETAQSALQRVLAVLPGRSGTSLVTSEGTGVLPRNSAVVPLLESSGPLSSEELADLMKAADAAEEEAGAGSYEGLVEIEPVDGGLVFRIAEPIAFEIGRADLNPAIGPLLRSIAAMCRRHPCEVVVEGHTCDLAIRTPRFGSHWDLSGARAAEVGRFLRNEGVSAGMISIRACGEHYPRVANVDEASRRRNRRVEVRVVFETTPNGR